MDKITKKKKILFLITKSNWGGAQRYVFDLATNLPNDSFDIVVAHGGKGELAEKLDAANIRSIELTHMQNTLSPIALGRAIFECIRLIRNEKPVIVHSNSSVAGFVGVVAGRLARAPRIIFTAHGWAFNEDRSKTQKDIFKFFHWLTVILSHTTIAVSKAIVEQMDWPWAQRKMQVVYPGRTIPEMKSRSEARGIIETKVIDSEANLSDFHKDIWIGTIAELHPIKRIHRAIDAIAALSRSYKDIRYVIIGDGEEMNKLRQQITDLGIENHVFFTGSIHEAARFLPAFDIFLLPSKSESFGYVLLEAGLAKLPVIATNVGGITDIITHEENGILVPADDTPEITDALTQLISEKTKRHTLAENHHTRATNFTLSKMTTEIARYY